jgi:hypothetical protein
MFVQAKSELIPGEKVEIFPETIYFEALTFSLIRASMFPDVE